MDNSLNLSEYGIVIIIVVVLIIIGIIILIVVWSGNNNNGGNGGGTTVAKTPLAPKNDAVEKALEEIKDNQRKQLIIVNDILNSKNDSSVKDDSGINDKLDQILSHQKKHIELLSSRNDSYISGLSDDDTSNRINEKDVIYDEDSTSKKKPSNFSFSEEDINGDKVEEFYHEEELDSSDIEKLGLEQNFKVPKISPPSIDYQQYSEDTEIIEDVTEPSFIKKNNDMIETMNNKDVKYDLDSILKSDLSTPDDNTIMKVNNKISPNTVKKIAPPMSKKINNNVINLPKGPKK